MAVTIFGGDLRTGLIRVRNIPALTGNVGVTLGAAGVISCGVRLPMRVPRTDATVDLYNLLPPVKSFLGWEENGVILNAGPIWNTVWDDDSRMLTLNAAGLRSYWQFRYVLPALTSLELPIGKDTEILSTAGVDLATIAKRLIQQAQAWTNGSVPLVYPADRAGSAQRRYEGHELHVLDEKLKQISEVENGPDLMFPARYTSSARTHIEWVMEAGNPRLGATTPHKWDATGLPNPALKGLKVTRDGTALTTDNYQTGATDETTEEGYPIMAKKRDSFLTGLGYPVLESDEDRTSVTTLSVLQGHANAAAAVGRLNTTQWSFQSRKNRVPRIETVSVGDMAVISTRDNPALGTDEHKLRIMEISSRVGDGFASFTCAPERTAV
jgi:hypothetical protein